MSDKVNTLGTPPMQPCGGCGVWVTPGWIHECTRIKQVSTGGSMSERVVVPETRIKAVADRMEKVVDRDVVRDACNAFAADLSQHPIVPTDEQLGELVIEWKRLHWNHAEPSAQKFITTEWQRRMFRAEPERPQDIPHRWNVKSENGQTYVCRGEHEKSAGCEWKPWPPEPEVPEAVDPIEFLFEELLHLAEYVGPLEKDTIGHIRQELERYRRGRGKTT